MPAQAQGLELLCQAVVYTTPTCMCASAVKPFEVFFLSGNDSHLLLIAHSSQVRLWAQVDSRSEALLVLSKVYRTAGGLGGL